MKVKQLTLKPLFFISALLFLVTFSGTFGAKVISISLERIKARMGAEILVVPYKTSTKVNLKNLLIQGANANYYLPYQTWKNLKETEGVGKISRRYFIKKIKTPYCEQEAILSAANLTDDFLITPWVSKKNSLMMKKNFSCITGSSFNVETGDVIQIEGRDFFVSAVLEKSGTDYDTSIFISFENASELLRGKNSFPDPEYYSSSFLIDTDADSILEDVLLDIKLHVRGIKAVKGGAMMNSISKGAASSKNVILLLTVFLIASLLFLSVFFVMLDVQRRKEQFALLRLCGSSKKMIICNELKVNFMQTIFGCFLAFALSLALAFPLVRGIGRVMRLNYITPDFHSIIFYEVLALVLTLLSSSVCAFAASKKASESDPAVVLKEV